jgi:signal transduction histidine kinase
MILFVLTVFSTFVVEFGVMLLLSFFSPAPVWLHALLDGILLTIVLFPSLYFFSYRPMKLHIVELSRIQMRLQDTLAERERAEADLRKAQAQLRDLSARLLTLQEEERRNVSRELHEELAQSLVVLKLRLDSIERRLTADQEQARDECESGKHLVDEVIQGIRRISGDLSPAILSDLGLKTALRRLAGRYARDSGLEVSVEIEDVDRLLPMERQIILYRIVQEALSNIVEHAEAKSLSVDIRERQGTLYCSVEDDGRGFDLIEAKREGPCTGLAIMDERARMLGGALEIRSGPGHGTRIELSVPSAPSGAGPEIA